MKHTPQTTPIGHYYVGSMSEGTHVEEVYFEVFHRDPRAPRRKVFIATCRTPKEARWLANVLNIAKFLPLEISEELR